MTYKNQAFDAWLITQFLQSCREGGGMTDRKLNPRVEMARLKLAKSGLEQIPTTREELEHIRDQVSAEFPDVDVETLIDDMIGLAAENQGPVTVVIPPSQTTH
jgi:hypothetical protein